MDRDLGIMIDGFQALIWLDEHSDEVGMDGNCRPCSTYAAALFRGANPREAMSLRCTVAQLMQRQVDAAIETMRRLCP